MREKEGVTAGYAIDDSVFGVRGVCLIETTF